MAHIDKPKPSPGVTEVGGLLSVVIDELRGLRDDLAVETKPGGGGIHVVVNYTGKGSFTREDADELGNLLVGRLRALGIQAPAPAPADVVELCEPATSIPPSAPEAAEAARALFSRQNVAPVDAIATKAIGSKPKKPKA